MAYKTSSPYQQLSKSSTVKSPLQRTVRSGNTSTTRDDKK